jgi:putative transposase
METVNRKVMYRLYPTAKQETALLAIKRGHQSLYNAALEQRRAAWKRQRHSITRTAQEKDLTQLRVAEETIRGLNAQASQVTLKRLDLAFQAFFRRVKAGETPGFPRFKSLTRFKGWGYKTHGDGWRLETGEGRRRPAPTAVAPKSMRHGHLRLQGVGKVRLRGGSRTPGTPKTCDITHRHGQWYASVTIACQPERPSGTAILAFDWGVETFAALARADGHSAPVANPRFLQQSEARLKAASRERDRKTKGSRAWRDWNCTVAKTHSKIARQRKDFHHQLSARLVGQATALFTEQLRVANMTRRPKPKPVDTPGTHLPNGAAAKAGLHKAILDGAPAAFLGMIRYKAAEAGVVYAEAPTTTLKPTQRCHACWRVEKKRLAERWHSCPCGIECGRDENAALVILRWGITHYLSIFLAGVWLCSTRSQELTARREAQNLPLEPAA